MKFTADVVSISLPRGKTDQYREGATVLVAQSGIQACPVAMLECYFENAAIDGSSSKFMFRGIIKTKSDERLRSDGGISYSRVHELMLQRSSKLGYDATKFGMHSFWAGQATAAARAGIPDCLFKHHGRWRSEMAKDGYVKDSEQVCLRVSKSLNL